MRSRREFLDEVVRIASATSVGLALPWRALQAVGLDGPSAPRARYWATASTPGIDCLACHNRPDKPLDSQHRHNPTTVTCLLCAQGCRGRCLLRWQRLAEGQAGNRQYQNGDDDEWSPHGALLS